jgi:hypothetical protein
LTFSVVGAPGATFAVAVPTGMLDPGPLTVTGPVVEAPCAGPAAGTDMTAPGAAAGAIDVGAIAGVGATGEVGVTAETGAVPAIAEDVILEERRPPGAAVGPPAAPCALLSDIALMMPARSMPTSL